MELLGSAVAGLLLAVDHDMEALEMMVKDRTEEGKVNWRCLTCQFSSQYKLRNDQARIHRDDMAKKESRD